MNNLSVDNSLSIWFLEDNPSYKAYIDYQEQFGSDEIFIAMLNVENALDSLHINKLQQLHQEIDGLRYVKTSFSLATAEYPIYNNGALIFDKLYNPKRSEKGLKSLLSKLPNISSQLVTDDMKHLFVYIQLNPTPNIESDRAIILPEIETYLTKYFPNSYSLTGAPVLNEAYSRGIYKESLVFGISTILVIAFMLLFLLPDRKYLFMSLCAVAVPIILLFGIITSFGFALNMISMLIPTILLVYSVSDAVHIINIYHKEGLQRPEISRFKLLSLSIRKSFTPCFYTTLTTIVGYFALYLSPLPAFKNMGLLTCAGLLLSFVLVYVILIIGLSFYTFNFEASKPILRFKIFNSEAVIVGLNRFTSNSKNSIILVSSFLIVIGGIAITKIKIDTDSLNLLAEGKAKQDLRLIESKLNGSSRLQINIATTANNSILTKDFIKSLAVFESKLQSNELLAIPVSVLSLKSFLEQRSPMLFQSNFDEEKLKGILADTQQTSESFFTFFSEDFETAGITVNVKELKTSELEKLISDISLGFESSFNTDDYSLNIQGFSVVFAQLNSFILETQFKSFFAAFFVAFLALWFFIKSFKTTILVLIPNLLPLLMLAIVMFLFDIPLDVSTAMITPIMLGIAMDDTIHLIYKYKRTKAIKGNAQKRIDKSMLYTGGALLSTTIALAAGFLIISTSAVPSVGEFGLLCSVTVAMALITDILFLPALLKKFDK
ncbi:efflux RND transporter permease subunit [Paucihalobacter sp.]|uniref:efflux RND transporter permease subunit n=2 Tax=Paucihalobacter sp. TaxID=2850405 RepID=UPI003D161DA5